MQQNTDMIFDLHSHILPVDDGVRDLTDAMATLQSSYNQGVRYIFATPHSFAFRKGPDKVEQFYDKLRDLAGKQLPELHLNLGCEVLCSEYDMEYILGALECWTLKAMGETRYVLTEFWTSTDMEEADYCVESLLHAGWHPVIAHVERYPGLFENPDYLRKLHEKVLFQINAYSIAEEKDETIRSNARRLLQEELVDFLGSDTHGMGHRPPMWSAAMEYIEQNCTEEYSEKLKYKNAMNYFTPKNNNERQFYNVLKDGMYGLAVADALGVPYESSTLEQMADSPCAGMVGYGHHNQPAGSWSDDTSMALCITDSLCKGIDPEDIAKKFIKWKLHKQYTATGVLFDIGRQTRRALNRFQDGTPAEYCGDYSENGNGNGGLMRTFPIAFYQCVKCPAGDENLQAFLEPIHEVSRITHGHEIGLICCGLYSTILREYLLFSQAGDTLYDIVVRAYQKARQTYTRMGGFFAKLIDDPQYFPEPADIMKRSPEELPSWGYALNTWNIALWSLLNTNSYKDCILKAINLGGDTDTNAAVAGSLAGVIYGKDNIPAEWILQLQNKRLIDLLCDKLNSRMFNFKQEVSAIEEFQGEFAFLSMKAPADITLGYETWPNTAITYYVLGVAEENRNQFEFLNTKQARKLYNKLPHNNESEESRLYLAVKSRFEQNPKDAEKLKNTGSMEIIYDTTGGHDNVLGRCRCEQCKGKEYRNLYGKTLMRVRDELKSQNM